MNRIDIRLKANDLLLLKGFVGKTLTSIEHCPFVFTNTVSQAVKFNFGDISAYLYSFTEPLDYYGSIEDVAVLSFEEPCYPAIEDKSFVSTPVLKTLQTIILVQENQKLFENSEQTYDVWLTRGIIFDFGDYQFSFEKAVWFSEEIKIRKGYNLIEEFCPTNDFCNNKNWKEGITAECSRDILVL